MAGAVLGYLINNFLIDSNQYKAWRGLELDELKEQLSRAGIMSESEFDQFSQQLDISTELQQVIDE